MLPRYGDWERDYRGRGLVVIGVHTPETEREADRRNVATFVERNQLRWRVLLDPAMEAWRRYGIEAWPTILVIDRAGIVRASYVGDDRASAIEADLRRLLGGEK